MSEAKKSLHRNFTLLALLKLIIIGLCLFLPLGDLMAGRPSYDMQHMLLYSAIAVIAFAAIFLLETRALRTLLKTRESDIPLLQGFLPLPPVLLLYAFNVVAIYIILAGYYAGMTAAELLFQARGGNNV